MPSKPDSVEVSADSIIEFASQRTQQHWDKTRQPYLMSSLGSDLKGAGIDYHTALGEMTLGALFSSRETNLNVVRHPLYRAKVGLIPVGESYEYAAQEMLPGADVEAGPARSPRPGDRRPRNARHVVMNFLEALGSLPDEDLRHVNIPASVLAKLVAGR